MRRLRLVVDNDRPGLPPAFYGSSAAEVMAQIYEETAPRVLAWRRGEQATELRGGPLESTASTFREDGSARSDPGGPRHVMEEGSRGDNAQKPLASVAWSSHPYLAGAVASLLGWYLAYLFGGVR